MNLQNTKIRRRLPLGEKPEDVDDRTVYAVSDYSSSTLYMTTVVFFPRSIKKWKPSKFVHRNVQGRRQMVVANLAALYLVSLTLLSLNSEGNLCEFHIHHSLLKTNQCYFPGESLQSQYNFYILTWALTIK